MAEGGQEDRTQFPTYDLPEGVTFEDMEVELESSANPLGIMVYILPETEWKNKHGRREYYLRFEDHKDLVLTIANHWGNANGMKDPKAFANEIVNDCRYPRDRWRKKRDWISAPQNFNARLRAVGRYDLEKDKFLRRYIPQGFVNSVNKRMEEKKVLREVMGNPREPLKPMAEDSDAEFGFIKSPSDRLWVANRVEALKVQSPDADEVTLKVAAMLELQIQSVMGDALNDEVKEVKAGPIAELKRVRDMLGLKPKPAEDRSRVLDGSLDQLIKLFDAVVESGLWDDWDASLAEEGVKMLLRKADRRFEDGTPEIDDLHFRVLAGMSMAEARELLGARGVDPYDPPSKAYRTAEKAVLEASRGAIH